METLDLRKQQILRAIVDDYVATAEPIGSQLLVEKYALGVKSATVRSEMAEMSEWGYLRQPHTSAGRIPSNLGYRFYVNELMATPVLARSEVQMVRRTIASVASELEAILRRTCQILTALTALPAVATSPDADDTELRQVFVSSAGSDKTLLVLLFSTGRTEHRLLTQMPLSATDALALAHTLNTVCATKSLGDLATLNPATIAFPTQPPALQAIATRLLIEVVALARSIREESPVFVEGTQVVLAQPEFRDIERLGQLLTTLQERAALLEMLTDAPKIALCVRIGEETGRAGMQDCAIVSSPYYIGDKERGSLAVVGPARMNYGRVSVAVQFMASTVSEVLTRLSG
jgi:heat-inducible transcriptional repressor